MRQVDGIPGSRAEGETVSMGEEKTGACLGKNKNNVR